MTSLRILFATLLLSLAAILAPALAHAQEKYEGHDLYYLGKALMHNDKDFLEMIDDNGLFFWGYVTLTGEEATMDNILDENTYYLAKAAYYADTEYADFIVNDDDLYFLALALANNAPDGLGSIASDNLFYFGRALLLNDETLLEQISR